MLGRLQMSLKDCSDAYDRLAKDVFDRNLIVKAFLQTGKGAKYDEARLEKAIKQIVSERPNLDENELMLAPKESPCKVYVIY